MNVCQLNYRLCKPFACLPSCLRLLVTVLHYVQIDFRPVDCETSQPLQYLPGYVSPAIYHNGIGAGWAWYPYSVHSSQLDVPGQQGCQVSRGGRPSRVLCQ